MSSVGPVSTRPTGMAQHVLRIGGRCPPYCSSRRLGRDPATSFKHWLLPVAERKRRSESRQDFRRAAFLQGACNSDHLLVNGRQQQRAEILGDFRYLAHSVIFATLAKVRQQCRQQDQIGEQG